MNPMSPFEQEMRRMHYNASDIRPGDKRIPEITFTTFLWRVGILLINVLAVLVLITVFLHTLTRMTWQASTITVFLSVLALVLLMAAGRRNSS